MTLLIFRFSAAADVDDADLWYESQSPGLVEYPVSLGTLLPFCYEQIMIVACMHGGQNPDHWQVR